MDSMRKQKEWGSDFGTPIAVLRLEPDALVARGFKFERGYDDLDNLRFHRLNDGLALVRHEHSPSPGTEVVVRDFSVTDTNDAVRALRQALEVLGLSRRELSWIHPSLEHRGSKWRHRFHLFHSWLSRCSHPNRSVRS